MSDPLRAALERWINATDALRNSDASDSSTFSPIVDEYHAAEKIARAALAAPVETAPEQPDISELALNVQHPDCHLAADAFWKRWAEVGKTHRHGYYEATWSAINAAIRTVGVVPHVYGIAQQAVPEHHDSLRDQIGQAISDEIAAGAETPDWCDSREIDRLADAVLAVLPVAQQAAPEQATSEYSQATSEYLKDAMRWRWIRSHLDDDTDHKLMEHKKGCDYGMKQFASLDAAVDASIAQECAS